MSCEIWDNSPIFQSPKSLNTMLIKSFKLTFQKPTIAEKTTSFTLNFHDLLNFSLLKSASKEGLNSGRWRNQDRRYSIFNKSIDNFMSLVKHNF